MPEPKGDLDGFAEALGEALIGTEINEAGRARQPPPFLWFARGLDGGDRAEFMSEVSAAAASGDLNALERCLEDWQRTGRALAEPALREILTADVIDLADFAEVQRPGETP